MKKVLLAVVVACAAIFAQAASCAWNVAWTYDSASDALSAGSYFLVALEGSSADGIAVDTKGNLVDNGAIKQEPLAGFTSNILMSGTFNNAEFNGTLEGLKDGHNGTYLALIVVDAANAYYGVSGAVALVGISDGTSSSPSNADAIQFSNTTDEFGGVMQTNIATIPEPTVLALLALGVAGLALKRKNA